ncbi:MAG: sigma-70 family RNA polymerase sigma factor [Patescibacteria group bacterium]
MPMKDKKHAFLEIYDAYADAIFRHCLFKVSDRELAKDMTQQAFMQFWTYMKDGRDIEKPKALLYRIAGNLAIDWYRKKKAESLEGLMDSGFDPSDVRGEDIEQTAEFKNVLKFLPLISQEDQNLIIWRFVEDLSPKEIGEILEERENTVSVRIHRALERLKNLMKTT